jgi:HEAT repeat protein
MGKRFWEKFGLARMPFRSFILPAPLFLESKIHEIFFFIKKIAQLRCKILICCDIIMPGKRRRMKTDFFITYHHNDELAARWIAGVLKDVPFSILMESWDFLPGNQPLEKIEHMTAIARSVLVLLSERFLQSGVDAESWQAVTETFDTNAVILFRIDSCDVEKALGAVTYTNLFGMKEAETRKRLLTVVGTPTEDKKETEGIPVTAKTREEVLEKRKAELEELLTTTIKHNYHMKLDLEQEVEKEVEIEDGKTGKKEKRKQWVWEAVKLETVLTDSNNYILVNPSGMGKTTFLTHVAFVLLDSAGDYPFVPLFNTCIALNNREGSIANFIHQRVESFYNNSQTAVVHGEWQNLCLLLDALDQSRDVDDIVSSFQLHDKCNYYKKAKILLSSRQNTADKVKAGFKKIRLKLPEDDEVRHYLGEENYKKLESHINASRELVTVPVLLEMLKTITEKGYDASKLWNRADLYTEFTRILMDQERSKPRFWQDPLSIRHFIENELEQALEKIAFFSLADNRILDIEKDKLVQYCETPEKKEALLIIGIILELFEDREQKIVFRHQSFQAYFAARYMYYRQPQLFRELVGDIAFFYNDVWYEVMRFFVGLEKDPQKAENIIDSILLRSNRKNFLKKMFRDWDKRKLEIYNLNQALRLVFTFLLMSEVLVSVEKVKAIHKKLLDLLLNRKQYFNFVTSNIDKYNHGNTGQLKNFTSLLALLLKNKDRDIIYHARETLKRIRSSAHITPIHKPNLKNKNESLPRFSDESLNKIVAEKDIYIIELLLRDKNRDVRRAAAYALGSNGRTKDIPLLVPLLKDKDEWVRFAASNALKMIVTEKDIPILKYLLKDKNGKVRSAAAYALGNILKTDYTSLLEPLIKDTNQNVRSAAAFTLRDIGAEKDIPLLEPLLRDKVGFVRKAAAEAFGNIGTSGHIPLLEPLIKSKYGDIRSAATKALGKIGTEKVIPYLELLLRDRNRNVRCDAAIALGNTGSSKAIPLLTPLLSDESWIVLQAVAEALGKIGKGNNIPLLAPLLRNSGWDVPKTAASAIEQIYKRSTPEMRIDDVLPKRKKKEALFLKTASPHPLHILHISDIHYALEKDPTITCIFHEFIRDIQKWRSQQNNEKIHSICLTGDIAQSGQKNQYVSINEKINAILNTTGCSKGNLFIIPGNHDVREYNKISPKDKTTLEQVRENKMNIDTGVLSNFENYHEFHEKFNHYYEFVETSGYLNSLPITDKRSGSPKPWYSRKLQDFPVRIIGLNSALFCLKEFSEYGKIRMGTHQFHEAYFQGKPGNIPKVGGKRIRRLYNTIGTVCYHSSPRSYSPDENTEIVFHCRK